MNITKEEKLRILDIAINFVQKYNDMGMCYALNTAINKVLGYDFTVEPKEIFPKYTRFNYFLKNPYWAIIKKFLTGSAFWDGSNLTDTQKEIIKGSKRRIKFLEYLKTTV